MREVVFDPSAPASTSPVAHATRGGGLIFVSGQMPRDPETGAIPSDPAVQARLTVAHCLSILRAAGSTPDKVLKATVFVTDLAVKPAVNALFAEVWGAKPPARDLVAVAEIGDGAVVEMSLIALA